MHTHLKKRRKAKTNINTLLLNHVKMSWCSISSALSTSSVCVKRSTTDDPASAASIVHPLPHNCAKLSSPSPAAVPSAVTVVVDSEDAEARKASIDDQNAAISFASGSTFVFAASLLSLTSLAKLVSCCNNNCCCCCCCCGSSLGSTDVEEFTRLKSRSRPSENASLLLNSGLEGGRGEDGGRVSDHNKGCATVSWSSSSSDPSSSISRSLAPLWSFSQELLPSRPVSSSSSEAAGSESAGVSTDASPSSLPVGSLISIL